MPTLDTLKPLLLDLPLSNRLSLIGQIRQSRRTSKREAPKARIPKTPKAKASAIEKNKEQLRLLFFGQPLEACIGMLVDIQPDLTPEQAFTFLTGIGVEL